ncbi:hypothetical protein MTER_39850 [Mycolicibacter terrae]|uniref:Transmembrane protein n=2 Tax=Mycolicibacter terrae TaxID=1788 RepID=A0AAD1I153_9MYCO|nr:hypothetical protein MTER_39850 [Mycolicibacter terrae]
MTDLPPGEWSLLLVGAWWPAPPSEPTAGKMYWSDQADVKGREAEHVQNQRTQFGSRNHGRTAEDMVERFRVGKERLLDAQEHCRAKSSASGAVADAVTELRSRLSGIASQGNQAIRDILAKNEPETAKLTAVINAINNANDEAATAGMAANNAIIDATQQMFTKMGVDAGAREWLEKNGANFEAPPRRPPLTADEMVATAAGVEITDGRARDDELPFPFGNGGDGQAGAGSIPPKIGGESAVGPAAGQGGTANPADAASAPGPVTVPAGAAGTGGGNDGSTGNNTNGGTAAGSASHGAGSSGLISNPSSGPAAGNASRGTSSNEGISYGGSGPAAGNASRGLDSAAAGAGSGGSGISGTPGGGFGASGGGGSGSGLAGVSPLTSSAPGLAGGSGTPATPAGLAGGGPTQAFASGMPSGPGGPGGPLHGGLDGSGLSQASAPQVPPSPSSTPMAGGVLGNLSHLASSSPEAASTAQTAGAATPAPTPASPPMTAGPTPVSSAPISAGPAAASGPLPGYGADLRPAAGAATGAPAAPAGAPAAPTTPSAPGSTTTPASGGTTVASSGDRPAPGRPSPAAGGQSGAAMAGGMAAGGTAGAGAGTAAKRLAEHQDLQHKVDAVARQAPNLAWAAGLRDDETTIVVVTDLAGGWIPPTVKLPPGVALLDPAHRRRSTSAMDLLGAVIAAATHEPNTYITEADPGDPVPGSGERARYGQRLDELGPTLIDAAGASTRLPRIVQTVAQAMARRSGVADNEVELFRQVVADTATRVVSAYPEHAPRDVADWMLLAAIDALIEGSEELAHYHLAWHQAVGVPHGGFTP